MSLDYCVTYVSGPCRPSLVPGPSLVLGPSSALD